MPIVILGANGQLGQEFCRFLAEEIVPLDRCGADLANGKELRRALEAIRPRAVINCAAYTLVDKAEAEPEAAFAVNAWGVRDLATICRDLDCLLMHFSTNYVFGLETARQTPYEESDLPGPQSTYAVSKLAGEFFVRHLCPRHFVVRTCGLYGLADPASKRGNFVETMLRKGAEGKPLRVIHDQVCTPTATWDLVRAAAQLLSSEDYGLYHATNSGSCTWFEFTREIFAATGRTVPIEPIETHEYPLAATRPGYSVLSDAHWVRQGFMPMRPWQEALRHYLCTRGQALAA